MIIIHEEKVRERILTGETITELVTLVAEEIDNLAGKVNGRLTAISAVSVRVSPVLGRGPEFAKPKVAL